MMCLYSLAAAALVVATLTGDMAINLARMRGADYVAKPANLQEAEASHLMNSIGLRRSRMCAMKIALGSDHAGFELKEKLKQTLTARGIEVQDQGTYSTDSVDYPDFARKVGEEVAAGKAERGILVCGSGIGMAIAANKVPGVRAANLTSEQEAQLSREHNDLNVLALG